VGRPKENTIIILTPTEAEKEGLQAPHPRGKDVIKEEEGGPTLSLDN